jgi:exodeoxyribonuclease V alpha subunit
LPEESLVKATCGYLKTEKLQTEYALNSLVEDDTLIRCAMYGKNFIYTKDMFDSESYIAARLKMMMMFPAVQIPDIDKQIEAIEKNNNISYANLQKEAITQALSKGLLILTGGPGTGKTTTLNAIIKILKNKGQKVLLCAPTGRAAQRMSDVTGDEAKTIHRLLEVAWDNNDRPEFKKNEKNMLKCDALVVDEVSMVDAKLFESVMRALPMGCRLILVGDSHQLPSVGAGNVLDDLISSQMIPYVELNEIFRQSMESLIVTNAHKIVKGIEPDITAKDNDFFFLPSTNKTIIEKTVIELCSKRLPATYDYDIYKDIQILSPGRKGDLGVTALNEKLQEVVNPPSKDKAEITVSGKILRTGDKVMQTKNNYDLLWTRDNGETGEGIFNGEIGIIDSINKKSRIIRVKFDDKTASYDFDFAPDLDLAYATTVHKSQGNEFEAVVIPLYRGAPQLQYRNLLYTAVTRAKKLLIIVGDVEVLRHMISNDRKNKRYSGLKYFLQESINE